MRIPKLKRRFKNHPALKPLLIATLTAVTLSGCGNSENFVFTNTPPVITGNAPTAVADQYTALGNTTMNVSALQGVLANDSDFSDATLAVVTEPTTGTDTTKLKTTAVKTGDRYVVNGQKVWISRIRHSDLMILLARTTPINEVKRKAQGLSIFMVDLKKAIGNGMRVSPIANMPGHETYEVFFDELEIPEENLIGEEGRGFYHILDGLNAERALIAAECIGDGYWFIDKARAYAGERIVFDRPIGQNQGVQFPIAKAFVNLEAANLMRFEACRRFDSGSDCGAQANMAKLLAADASWEAANACIQTHGGFGFAREYDVERKFRETRLYQVAPISTNLILSYVAEHILGMPRSF